MKILAHILIKKYIKKFIKFINKKMFKKCITGSLQNSGKSLRRKNELVKMQKKMMMLLHEYQAQGLLKKYEVPIPKGSVVLSASEVTNALKQIGKTPGYAVKAQVHTGGRGLGYFKENNFKGGVHIVSSEGEVNNLVPKMIGNTLITKQTGEKGIPCKALYIVEKVGNGTI